MRNCKKCQQPVPQGQYVCPNCQAPYIEETIICPSCGQENDMDASSCQTCGYSFFTEDPSHHFTSDQIFDTGQLKKKELEVADRFTRAFEKRLKEEHDPSLHSAYIDRFFKSKFRESANLRLAQFAESIENLTGDKKQVEKQKKAILDPAFDELLDYFMIHFCRDLNEVGYPEEILKYHGQPLAKINLLQMIKDFLAFDQEDETVYFDFVEMPPQRLKNAADAFLAPRKGETLYFICDLSLLGNCKDGFSMTSSCIYWKLPMEAKQRVYFQKIRTIKRQEDWILINGIFFNAGKSLNLKLIRLLYKLKYLFRTEEPT